MVSVAMATYNGAAHLREQLDSILSQIGSDDELVVSDDGSTDATPGILADYSARDPRVKIFRNPSRSGVNSNFANALSHVKGDYVFLSDQDDVWEKGKVERCLEVLERADLVVHDGIITDKDLQPQNKTLFSELNVKGGFWNNFFRNRFTGCCMAFRREILGYVLPLPVNVDYYHDSWLGLLVSLKGRVECISEPLIRFRRHDSATSSAGSGSRFGLMRKLGYRVILGRDIIKRILKIR